MRATAKSRAAPPRPYGPPPRPPASFPRVSQNSCQLSEQHGRRPTLMAIWTRPSFVNAARASRYRALRHVEITGAAARYFRGLPWRGSSVSSPASWRTWWTSGPCSCALGSCRWADGRTRRKLSGCSPEPRSCAQRLSQTPSVFGQPGCIGAKPRSWRRARCLGCSPLGARAVGRGRRVTGAVIRRSPPGRSRGRAACGCRSRRPAGSIPHLTGGSR